MPSTPTHRSPRSARTAVRHLLPLLLLAACAGPAPRQSLPAEVQPVTARGTVELGESLVVRSDVRLEPRKYLRPTPDGAEAVVLLEGLRGVTVDLEGVVLRGAEPGTAQETLRGTGILIRDCREVTVRGGELGGYRVCLAIEDSRDVVVEDMVFEGWYAQRLASTVATEAEEDRLDPELPGPTWRGRYGAAVWIGGSDLVQVRRCHGRHGQNGILLVESGHCSIHDNDFSFLSGWGLGLWASSANRVAHNVLDYDVRGYSHDVFATGQGSAAMLLVAGSCDNLFARNSATHGGVGALVLGAAVGGGSGALAGVRSGGCDRNVWIENDLRHGVVAGLRIVRSDGNQVLRNLLSGAHGAGLAALGCQDTVVVGNEIDDVRGRGIVLEGCQRFLVADNSLRGDQVGLEISSAGEGLPSRGHWVQENEFSDNDQDLVLENSRELVLHENLFPPSGRTLYVEQLDVDDLGVLAPSRARSYLVGQGGSRPSGFVQRSHLVSFTGEEHPDLYEARSRRVTDVPGEKPAFKHAGAQLGPLSTVLIGPYGPWDFRTGEPRPDVRFPGGLLTECSWDAVWFHWEPNSDPRGERDVWRARRFHNVARSTVSNFRNPWGSGQIRQALGSRPFGLIASTRLDLEQAGAYRLTVVCDDGVELRIDGTPVLEDWVWHPRPKKHTLVLELEAGSHELELEYFQVEGAAALSLDLERIDA